MDFLGPRWPHMSGSLWGWGTAAMAGLLASCPRMVLGFKVSPLSSCLGCRMTRLDLKNYLQSIYNVPVAAVRTRIQHGECGL